jgi:hypothetical protein
MTDDAVTGDDAPLLEIALDPDPVADAELGPGDESLMTDDEVAGSRLIIVRRAVEPIDPASGKGGVLGLGCTFHAAAGARYIFAQVRVDLISPAGAVFADIAPRHVTADDAVKITVKRNGELSLGREPVKAGVGGACEIESVYYPSLVEGSGGHARYALWRMRENGETRQGIGLDHFLAMTVPEAGDYEAEVTVTAQLARSGLAGIADAFRALTGRPTQQVLPARFRFSVPRARSRQSWFTFTD